MKSGRRRPTANTPKSLANQFRECKELRSKVSEAELAAAKRKAAAGEPAHKGKDRKKPSERGRAH